MLRSFEFYPKRLNKLVAAFAAAILVLASPLAAFAYPVDPLPKLVTDPGLAAAGEYNLDLGHASLTIRLSHMGLSIYTIRFNDIKAHYHYDPAHPTASHIEVQIDPASIDTGNPQFNVSIAKAYFQISKFPTITFNSTRISAAGNHGTVEGVLDMHGVKKPLALDVTYHGFFGEEKPERMGFSGTTTLKRSDFGVDPYVPAEGDEVTVLIEAEFRKA